MEQDLLEKVQKREDKWENVMELNQEEGQWMDVEKEWVAQEEVVEWVEEQAEEMEEVETDKFLTHLVVQLSSGLSFVKIYLCQDQDYAEK